MKLSQAEVTKIADLARIELSPGQIAKFQKELGEIIDYNARRLSEIRKKAAAKARQEFRPGRPDSPAPPLSQDLALANAPEKENGFFVVPKVLEQ